MLYEGLLAVHSPEAAVPCFLSHCFVSNNLYIVLSVGCQPNKQRETVCTFFSNNFFIVLSVGCQPKQTKRTVRTFFSNNLCIVLTQVSDANDTDVNFLPFFFSKSTYLCDTGVGFLRQKNKDNEGVAPSRSKIPGLISSVRRSRLLPHELKLQDRFFPTNADILSRTRSCG